MTIITVDNGHFLQPGDVVTTTADGTRWQQVRRLMLHPRLKVVAEVTATTLTLRERRMTWREWWRATIRVLTTKEVLMLNLSQHIQILFLHNGITLHRLMLAVCVAGFLIAGMVLAHANEAAAPVLHSERFPLVVMKITQEPDGWVTTEQRSGQVCTYSPAAIATLDEWRDEMRYFPRQEGR